ncbi:MULTISPECIES: electron transport complex subunit RsxE [Halanaerobium]|jgi:electron transport complex protein RnfE|uniref:Ion-translocating oxidoreductase complex subunit E n=1 Tax=Halanaerobium saccharolyticum TaxID=43595 RepID=A0A4R6SA98_9FIRM|nr:MULTISPECIES: electron transport complex subunit E [Halanaerobium]PUU90738.1 MAG: electron transport complex protein RnfE [Halanaerobium sp.]PUU94172.1 MAG: electron transport complex protein RnfE [Halanaerobium sp.]TDP96830.1 electron transport complex protein RnfE [Halanaerobium saccharolyticum]
MSLDFKQIAADFKNGLWAENPIIRLVIGMCPTLAVTNTSANGLAMGLATSFVLIMSEIVISLIKKLIPANVRIPSYILIIATFVTFTDYFLKAFFPGIAASLSIFIPLIVVNCLILGRQEAFASKHSTPRAIADGIGMGLGFTWVLTLLGMIREFFGMGSMFGVQLLGEWYRPMVIMVLPAGAFITLGILVGIMNQISREGK